MACTSCGTKSGGGCAPAGCKSNGNCSTGGCNALNVYDWFMDMELPDSFTPFGIVEVRFKGSRKEYYRNSSNLELYTGDQVWTESSVGMDIGTVSATGEIMRLQLKKKGISETDQTLKKIVRKANESELIKFSEYKTKENEILERARTIAFELKLSMKISDIEYQGDGRKIIFFYTAEQRVDFRELIKRYSDQFKVKIEMRHISYREEASRLGGIGDCGRPLCCSTWLTDYKQVNIGAARTQNLSINMEKLAGQCGRLKCCLNFELDQYIEAVDDFPKLKIVKLNTVDGTALSRKTDILKRLIWFSYEDNQNWVPIEVKTVNELLAKNQAGEILPTIDTFAPVDTVKQLAAIAASESDMIGNEQLLREDKEFEENLRRQREKQNDNRNNKNKNFNNKKEGQKPWENKNKPGNFDKNKTVSSDRPASNNQTGQNNNAQNNNKKPATVKPWEKDQNKTVSNNSDQKPVAPKPWEKDQNKTASNNADQKPVALKPWEKDANKSGNSNNPVNKNTNPKPWEKPNNKPANPNQNNKKTAGPKPWEKDANKPADNNSNLNKNNDNRPPQKPKPKIDNNDLPF